MGAVRRAKRIVYVNFGVIRKLFAEVLLPIDTVVTDHFPEPIDEKIVVKTVPSNKIPADKMGMDIGEKTRKLYACNKRFSCHNFSLKFQ